MSAPVPTLPCRPADLAGDHTLAELADAYARHLLVVTSVRAGGRPVTPDRTAAHAVAALALGRAIVADLHDEWWPIVRDALVHGAGHDMLAAAMDLDPTEVAAGLAAWADRQAADGALSDAEHAAVRALAFPPCEGADDLCGAPAGQPCAPWCPSQATGGAPW